MEADYPRGQLHSTHDKIEWVFSVYTLFVKTRLLFSQRERRCIFINRRVIWSDSPQRGRGGPLTALEWFWLSTTGWDLHSLYLIGDPKSRLRSEVRGLLKACTNKTTVIYVKANYSFCRFYKRGCERDRQMAMANHGLLLDQTTLSRPAHTFKWKIPAVLLLIELLDAVSFYLVVSWIPRMFDIIYTEMDQGIWSKRWIDLRRQGIAWKKWPARGNRGMSMVDVISARTSLYSSTRVIFVVIF